MDAEDTRRLILIGVLWAIALLSAAALIYGQRIE
jgi:hypothetical protein